MRSAVNALKNHHWRQQVRVNEFSRRSSWKQGQGHGTLNRAVPKGPAASRHPARKLRNPYSKTGKETKKEKSRGSRSGELGGKVHSSTAALFLTQRVHLSAPLGKVCAEGQQSINQNIHHKRPNHRSQVSFTCTEKREASPHVVLLLNCPSPPWRAGITFFILFFRLLFNIPF